MNMMRPKGIKWVQATACEFIIFFYKPLDMLTNAQDFAAKMKRMTLQRSLRNT
jgi:hypothetical protein